MKLLISTILLSNIYAVVSQWVDSRGYTCETYANLDLCIAGSYGNGWRFDVDGTFKDYADSNGYDASDKCCDCILSSSLRYLSEGCNREELDSTMW